MIYCVVPRELAAKLHEVLRRHFVDDPNVEVVVERRRNERRGEFDRRSAQEGSAPDGRERRRIHNVCGRRVGDRRAELTRIEIPLALPRRAARFASELGFVERKEPIGERAEDLDSARLVTRFQAGDREAFSALYVRYFDRIYSYLKLLLRDVHEAEDAAQEVFTDALAHLGRFELRGHPVRAWLFTVARHRAIAILRRSGRWQPMSPEELEAEIDQTRSIQEQSLALGWIKDPDLAILVERLPQPQRQVLAMRYLLDMRSDEIAEALELTSNHVSVLQYRAFDFLRKRLEALGRTPERPARGAKMRAPLKHNRVARSRRYSL